MSLKSLEVLELDAHAEPRHKVTDATLQKTFKDFSNESETNQGS